MITPRTTQTNLLENEQPANLRNRMFCLHVEENKKQKFVLFQNFRAQIKCTQTITRAHMLPAQGGNKYICDNSYRSNNNCIYDQNYAYYIKQNIEMSFCTCYYRLLGMTPTKFDHNVISREKKELFRIIHPDKNKHPMATKATQWVIKAAEVLGNPEGRLRYRLNGKNHDLTQHSCLEAKEAIKIIKEIIEETIRSKTAQPDIEPSQESEVQEIFDRPEPNDEKDNGRNEEPEDPIDVVDSGESEEENEYERQGNNGSETQKEDSCERQDDKECQEKGKKECKNKKREEQENRHTSDGSFNETIKIIIDHRFRTIKGVHQLKFKVIYMPFSVYMWVEPEAVIQQGYALQKYIKKLRKRPRPTSFNKTLNFRPTILSELKDSIAQQRQKNQESQ